MKYTQYYLYSPIWDDINQLKFPGKNCILYRNANYFVIDQQRTILKYHTTCSFTFSIDTVI